MVTFQKQSLAFLLVVSLAFVTDTGWIRRSDKSDFDTGAGPKRPADSGTIAATSSAHCPLPRRVGCTDSCGLDIPD